MQKLEAVPLDESTTLTDPMTTSLRRHVVFLVHGLGGSPDNLYPLERKILHHDGNKSVISHICVANTPRKATLDGVSEGGSRIAQEILKVVGQNPDLNFISLIGNSLGGLYCRYAVMELFNPETGTIAGLRPISFTTIATPHLGTRVHSLTPRILQKLFYGVLGKSVKELYLADREEGQYPLLMRMAMEDDFMKPLRAFSRVRAYGSRSGDFFVHFASSLFGMGQRIDSTVLSGLSLHTHHVPLELEMEGLLDRRAFQFEERMIIKGLNTGAEWSKVVVEWNSFRNIPYTAHNRIAAYDQSFVEAAMYKAGRPVLDHISKFVIEE